MNKRSLFLATAVLSAGALTTLRAEVRNSLVECGDITVRNIVLANTDSLHVIAFDLGFNDLDLDKNQAILLTPMLVYPEADTVRLRPIGIYSRSRYYHYLRSADGILGGDDAIVLRTDREQLSRPFSYICNAPRDPSSPSVNLCIDRTDYGCCGTLLAHDHADLADWMREVNYTPDFVFVRPPQRPKKLHLNGSANIEFEVNKIDIQPDRANNRKELEKIRQALDSVHHIQGTIDSIRIQGFASPDGPYDKNVILAQGRTEAIAAYVTKRYNVKKSLIRTSSEPEDWRGFRKLVAASTLPNKQKILDVASDTRYSLDERERLIKQRFPGDYDEMRKDILMRLRHTDYSIGYTLPVFSNIDTILMYYHENPRLLSQEEFYLAAEQYKQGSPEFIEIMRTAGTYFRRDEIANLNAANAALMEENYKEAERLLESAGKSAEAEYTRGTLAALRKEYAKAREYFEAAQHAGLDKASAALKQLDKISSNSPSKTY